MRAPAAQRAPSAPLEVPPLAPYRHSSPEAPMHVPPIRRSFAACLVSLLLAPSTGSAQNVRGASTGPTTARGFSHPDQYLHLQDRKPADNMYPVVPHPEQDAAARAKLAALEKRFGKKPNIVVILLDDVGLMDPGLQRRRRRGGQRHAGDGRPGAREGSSSPRPTRRRPARPPAPPSTPARIRSTTASCARPCTARPAGSTAPSRCPSSSSSRATSPRASASGTSGRTRDRCRRTWATTTTVASWASPTCTRSGATSTSTRRWRCPRSASP